MVHCAPPVTIEDSVTATLSHPIPPHILAERNNVFELYGFIVHARKIVFRLIRKYNLDINAELFFLGVVLHAVDMLKCMAPSRDYRFIHVIVL